MGLSCPHDTCCYNLFCDEPHCCNFVQRYNPFGFTPGEGWSFLKAVKQEDDWPRLPKGSIIHVKWNNINWAMDVAGLTREQVVAELQKADREGVVCTIKVKGTNADVALGGRVVGQQFTRVPPEKGVVVRLDDHRDRLRPSVPTTKNRGVSPDA